MKKLFFLLVLVVGFVGCKKDDKSRLEAPKPPELYMLSAYNNSNMSRYRLYIYSSDFSYSDYFYLNSGDYIEFSLKANKRYYWEALQLDGYLLYPTKREGSFYLDFDKSIKFPYR